MKRTTILFLFLLPISAILIWWEWSAKDPGMALDATPQTEPTRARERSTTTQAQTLARVTAAAQRRLPEVSLENKDGIAFAFIDPQIDELNIMEAFPRARSLLQ